MSQMSLDELKYKREAAKKQVLSNRVKRIYFEAGMYNLLKKEKKMAKVELLKRCK